MIRILLVEDDPVIRDTTSYFLKCQQNFEVVCADTGGEALSHAREKFDVILMDILLPDTNGMDLCQRLRSWHHCPIIFTSCLDDTDTVVRALELGGLQGHCFFRSRFFCGCFHRCCYQQQLRRGCDLGTG